MLKNRYVKPLILFVIILIIISRATILFSSPRLWAEEGSRYLNHSLYASTFKGVFFLPQFTAGYFNLLASIPTTIAAKLIPLEHIPLFLTLFSFAIYLLCFCRILFVDTVFTKTTLKKALVCFGLLFFVSSTASGETWLNTINLQVLGGVYAILVVFTESNWYIKKRLIGDCIILLIFGLSGPYAVFIGLAFFVKTILERQLPNIVLFLTLSFSLVTQASAYIYLKSNNLLSTKKTLSLGIDHIMAGVGKYFVFDAVIGEQNANKLVMNWGLFYTVEDIKNSEVFLSSQFMIGIISILLLIFITYKSTDLKWFFITISFLIPVYLLVPYFAVNGLPGSRYSLVPGFVFLIVLIIGLSSNSLSIKVFSSLILVLGLFFGIKTFWTYRSNYFFCRGVKEIPHWKNELQKHNSLNGAYKINIWPKSKIGWWYMNMPNQKNLERIANRLESLSGSENFESRNLIFADSIVMPQLCLSIDVETEVETTIKLVGKKEGEIIFSTSMPTSDELKFNTKLKKCKNLDCGQIDARRNIQGFIVFDELQIESSRKINLKEIRLTSPFSSY